MLKYCRQNKDIVLSKIKQGQLDSIAISNSSFVDDIIHEMHKLGVLNLLDKGIKDKRADNTVIPFNLVLALSVASKMKTKTSLTDIPYAIQDHRLLSTIGYNLVDSEGLKNGLMTEGAIRFLVNKYESIDFINFYNNVVQNYILPHMDMTPNIHILDCTKIKVNYDNSNYEGSTFGYDREGNKMRGYKLASLRGIYNDVGVIEDIRFDTLSKHDLALSEEMLKTTPCFHEKDILIMDRGFISREVINYLKNMRKVDTYIPVRKGMYIYEMAIECANEIAAWVPHPTRKGQMICNIPNLGEFWKGTNEEDNVELNSCVVWFEDTQSYAVFITTDLSRTAEDIIKTYQLRPEIEEDFRQLKDFWKLEDFKSTKLNVISFHLICVLLGYLFYQLYLDTKEGEKYIGKCLPVILKNYKSKYNNMFILYSGDYFCTMSIKEFIEFRDKCNENIKGYLLEFVC